MQVQGKILITGQTKVPKTEWNTFILLLLTASLRLYKGAFLITFTLGKGK